MRITSLMIYNQLAGSLQRSMDEFARLNEQLATGKKIGKPSDDVTGAINSMGYRLSISSNEQYKRNIDQTNIQLDFTSKIVSSVSDSLLDLHELASMGNNAQAQEQRDFYSSEAAQWRDYFLSLSNSKLGSKYVFSGQNTDKPAFVYNTTTGKYDYQGNTGETKVLIDDQATATMNIQGSRVFSFALTDPLPTALSDGTPVQYTQAADPVTGINTVTVTIGNAGDAGYDTFSFSNLMDIANVMSSSWQYKGIDGNSLNADAAVSEQMAMHRIAALAKPLDDARIQALNIESEIGSRQVLVNDQSTRLDSSTLSFQNSLTKTEDADMNQIATDLIKTQTALQAMMQSASRILSQSLLDFLK
ncbi:MAG TPA: flagellar hook-associated protein FlgL [Thermodesulfovibrionales bacterium]|nr:flagellar hook-associated protein FlgL [Thermodesulfovibrionales bacterium]